jgi:hypothetical protein
MLSKYCLNVDVDCLYVVLSPCDSSARYPCNSGDLCDYLERHNFVRDK